MNNLSTGLLLMAAGMVTVFVILLIVIYFGKLLIATVNRLPDKDSMNSQNSAQAPVPAPQPAPAEPVPAATEAGNGIYDLITPVGGTFKLSPDSEGRRPNLPFKFKKGDVLCKITNAEGESSLCASEDGTILAVLVENGSRVDINDVLMNIGR
ncbi:MAG: OadG family protein [Bacteroidales bacterium]|nr:OadG family protein [Bacteroidales bacterium]